MMYDDIAVRANGMYICVFFCFLEFPKVVGYKCVFSEINSVFSTHTVLLLATFVYTCYISITLSWSGESLL